MQYFWRYRMPRSIDYFHTIFACGLIFANVGQLERELESLEMFETLSSNNRYSFSKQAFLAFANSLHPKDWLPLSISNFVSL